MFKHVEMYEITMNNRNTGRMEMNWDNDNKMYFIYVLYVYRM